MVEVNNKGQTGLLGYFATVGVFVVIWALWLGSFISTWGEQAITSQGLTGLEAFLFANINLFIFFGLLIGSIAFVAFGGGGG